MKWTPEMCREQLELKQRFGLDKLTKAQLTQGIDSLKMLIQQAERGECPAPIMGICRNWHLLWGLILPEGHAAYSIVSVLSTWWDHPLRREPLGDFTCCPIKVAKKPSDRWAGKYREARLHLMRYMLKRLRDWRRRAPE